MRLPIVVAMFGLSGVGKRWIARQVCARHPVVLHLEASALLRAALNQSGEAFRTAAEDVMADNQRRLAEAFVSAHAAEPDRPVLFDGHSVIDNDSGLVDIPAAVIAPLRPDHIVFVADTGAAIASRRAADTRHWPLRTADDLGQHQARALLGSGHFDLLCGSHPHIMQPLEAVRDRLCLYSLGNLTFTLLEKCGALGSWAMTAGLVFEVVIGFDDIGPAQVARYEVHPFVEHLLDDGSSELVALGDYEGRKAADLRALFAAIFPS